MAVGREYPRYKNLGVGVGQYTGWFPFINNHLHFIISYHTDQLTGLSKVVGFEAVPASIKHSCAGNASSEGQTLSGAVQVSAFPEVQASQGTDVTFSYSMEYKVSNTGHLPCASVQVVF